MTYQQVQDAHYLTEKEVAQITKFALATLRNQRSAGRGIPYLKLGKSVRYAFQDVIGFMERHRIQTQAT